MSGLENLPPLPNPQSFFSKFPEIDLGDYVMRDMMLGDRNEYLAMMMDPEINQYQSDEELPKSIDDATRDIRFFSNLFYHKYSVFWAIAEKATNKFVGDIGYSVWYVYNRRSEISYNIAKQYQRRGIAGMALKAALEFGFSNMGLARIEARTMVNNIPSQNLLAKMHFKEEGTLRNYRVIRGGPMDIKLFSLIPSDYYGK